MKKVYLALMAAAMLSLSIVSCQKEEAEGTTVFTARMEQPQGSKVEINNRVLSWSATQDAMVYYQHQDWSSPNSSQATITPSADDPTMAVITTQSSIPPAGTEGYSLWALYPKISARTNNSSNLYSTYFCNIMPQRYLNDGENGIELMPMHGELNSDNQFVFRNLCGVFKISVQQSGTSLSGITVRVGGTDNISGFFTITRSATNPTLTDYNATVTNYNQFSYWNMDLHSSTIWFTQPRNISSAQDFYIFLPPGEYQDMEITFYDQDNNTCIKHKTGTTTVERNTLYPINVGSLSFTSNVRSSDVLPGIFYVQCDASGNPLQKVQFSRGNVNYNFANSTWSFAKQQWAVIGSPSTALTYLNEDLTMQQFPASTGNVSGADNNVRTGLIDRFCWSGTPSEGTPHYGLNPSLDASAARGTGVLADWANNFNVGSVTGWHTMGMSEWACIYGGKTSIGVYGRPNPTTKIGCGNVLVGSEYLRGIILLPDEGWELPAGLTFTPGTTYGYPFTMYAGNKYTIDQWRQMENNGAVFIPYAGESELYNSYMGSPMIWSNVSYSNGNGLAFNGTTNPGSNNDPMGQYTTTFLMSVRLAKTVTTSK